MAPSDAALGDPSPLRENELADADALVSEAGWNQTADDWRIFLALGSVLAVRTPAGRVIATAAMLPYGGGFAWISMVLVASEFRRRGLASMLLNRCIADIVARGLVPVLDATPAGRAVYTGLGFADAWGFRRFAREAQSAAHAPVPAPAGIALRPITDGNWDRLCAYDANIFGADRSGLLARLRGRVPAIECVAERNGEIVGAVLGRDGRIATQIGPLVAQDEATARALLAHALDRLSGPQFIDVPDARTAVIDDLSARGFVVQRPLTRMLYQRDKAFDDGHRTFAVVGPEFG